MINVFDIKTPQWSISLQGVGQVVTDLDDIKQCLYIIIGTVKGSTPLLLDFGCGLYDWLDEPLTTAAPKIVRDIREAVTKWEPRIIIQNISYDFRADGSARILFFWAPVEGTRPGTTLTTEFGVKEGLVYLVDGDSNYILTNLGLITV